MVDDTISYAELALQTVIQGVKKGLIDENQEEVLVEMLGNVGESTRKLAENLELSKTLLKVGSENAGVAMNGVVVAAGIYTGGNSAVQYRATQNLVAKNFYLLSVVFSLSAVGNCGIAVVSRACELSGVGVLSEALGAGFMWCGNASRAAALQAEGKPVPPELRKSLRKRPAFFKNNDIAFAMPGSYDSIVFSEILANIPFEKVGKVIRISITIYAYSKLVITAYKYGQQFITKYIEKKHSIAPVSFRIQVKFIVISLCRCSAVRKANAIYKFAIS